LDIGQQRGIAELRLLDTFCTPIEERFERITRIGKHALQVPVVAITTVTREKQWFKSVTGWNVAELPITHSLCRRAIEKGAPVMVPDLRQHLRYANHPLVTGAQGFRFYGAVPLRNAHGTIVGTVCAMDYKPRRPSRSRRQTLFDLAELAQREMFDNVAHSVQSALISKLSVAKRQVLLDPLTKTWNRQGLVLLLEESIDAARVAGHNLALIAIDIDRFNAMTDRFGSSVSDSALRMVAKALLSSVREGDSVCRFGGDEFLIIMSNVAHPDVERIAQRISERIAIMKVPTSGKESAPLSVSVETAWVDAGNETTAEQLVRAAGHSLDDGVPEPLVEPYR